jgi:GNAT superfamily N-acetyltransferase
VLEEQVFDPAMHDRAGFRCGEPALDEFLHKYAAQQSAKGLTSIFVLVDDAGPRTILGFYALSAAQICLAQLSESERKKLPRYPVPCFRMGRLARSAERRGSGIGSLLMGLAVERCLKAKTQVAAYALLVDAENDQAKTFYEHFGFVPCMDAPMSLYIPLD